MSTVTDKGDTPFVPWSPDDGRTPMLGRSPAQDSAYTFGDGTDKSNETEDPSELDFRTLLFAGIALGTMLLGMAL